MKISTQKELKLMRESQILNKWLDYYIKPNHIIDIQVLNKNSLVHKSKELGHQKDGTFKFLITLETLKYSYPLKKRIPFMLEFETYAKFNIQNELVDKL